MVWLQGIYDGSSVKITEKFNDKKHYKVVVTFIEEIKPILRRLSDMTDKEKDEFSQSQIEWIDASYRPERIRFEAEKFQGDKNDWFDYYPRWEVRPDAEAY